MTRLLLTGQVVRAIRSACLPILCILVLPLAATAQNGVGPVATVKTGVHAADDEGNPAANPAPEPDTWMLLGTGAVVLLLLYTKRRMRLMTPRPAQQQT